MYQICLRQDSPAATQFQLLDAHSSPYVDCGGTARMIHPPKSNASNLILGMTTVLYTMGTHGEQWLTWAAGIDASREVLVLQPQVSYRSHAVSKATVEEYDNFTLLPVDPSSADSKQIEKDLPRTWGNFANFETEERTLRLKRLLTAVAHFYPGTLHV